jgi:hypothetical protein
MTDRFRTGSHDLPATPALEAFMAGDWADPPAANDDPVRPSDLLLLDLGAEARSLYTADVTRTLPVTGTFTPLQRHLYQLVSTRRTPGSPPSGPGRGSATSTARAWP